MIHTNIDQFNTWAKRHIFDESKFDEDGFLITENNHNYKSTGVIASIFENHWNSYYAKYKNTLDILRPNADKEVHKIIDCSNHNLGFSVYTCRKCDEVIFSHHTCKGKLCSSCGIKAQKIKTQHILEKCINIKHRHITLLFLILYVTGSLMSYLLVILCFNQFLILCILLLMAKLRKEINLNTN